MAPSKKKLAKTTESIASRLALVVKSGKYSLGYKSALKQMRKGDGELNSVALSLGDWSVRLRRSLWLTIIALSLLSLQPSSSWLLEIAHHSASPRLSTTPCCRRLRFTTLLARMSLWAPLQENCSESGMCFEIILNVLPFWNYPRQCYDCHWCRWQRPSYHCWRYNWVNKNIRLYFFIHMIVPAFYVLSLSSTICAHAYTS